MPGIDPYIDKAIDHVHAGRLRSAEDTIEHGISSVVADVARKLHPASPSLTHLVHYTGTDVLFSLLDAENDRAGLRLYDTVHANDPEEGRFLLNNWVREGEDYTWMWKEKETEGTKIDFSGQEEPEWGYPGHGYVVSFFPTTVNKDNTDRIVFWKEYGRQGAGCSLSIPTDKIVSIEECPLTAYRVRYGSEVVPELIEELHRELLQPIATRIKEVDHLEGFLFDAAQSAVRDELQLFRHLYKDLAYEHEEEHRLVVPYIRQREGNSEKYERRTNDQGESIFRHYLTHSSLFSNQIFGLGSRITLGPTVPHRENVKHVIEILLARKSISGTEVTLSEISYRSR